VRGFHPLIICDATRSKNRGCSSGTPDPEGGVPPPGGVKFGEKTAVPRGAKKGQKWSFLGLKWHFNGGGPRENVQKNVKKRVFGKNVLRITHCVFGLQGTLSAWRKPANLYSTKCRFFGPPPPLRGHRGGDHPPDGLLGGPPQNASHTRTPAPVPDRLMMG
jgi:hypothetical protein